MSRSEITAWNTGAELAPVSDGGEVRYELIAMLTGQARAELGGGITAFLLLSRADLAMMLHPDAYAALEGLSRDRWAYWVREGYEKARAERRR